MSMFDELEKQLVTSVTEKLHDAFRSKILTNNLEQSLAVEQKFKKLESDLLTKFAPSTAIEKLQTELAEVKNNGGGGARTLEIKRETENEIKTENLGHVHALFDEVLSSLQVKLAPALIGPTGSTKTFVTMQLAKALGCKHYVMKKLCRATPPHELVGYMTSGGTYVKGAFSDPIKDGGMVVLDELDAANENVVLLAKDLRNRSVWMPYGMQDVHPECLVIATMNTWGQGATREYVGRLAQDAALLNEFVTFEWNYDQHLESSIATDEFHRWGGVDDKTLQRFFAMFWKLRAAAEVAKVRVIFGTRNLKHCAALLTRGYSFKYVLQHCVFHGAKDEDINRIKKALAEPIPEEDYDDMCLSQIQIGSDENTEEPEAPETSSEETSSTIPKEKSATTEEILLIKQKLRKANTDDKNSGGSGVGGSVDSGDQIPI